MTAGIHRFGDSIAIHATFAGICIPHPLLVVYLPYGAEMSIHATNVTKPVPIIAKEDLMEKRMRYEILGQRVEKILFPTNAQSQLVLDYPYCYFNLPPESMSKRRSLFEFSSGGW